MLIPIYVQNIISELGLEWVAPGGSQRGYGTWISFLVLPIRRRYPDPAVAASALQAQINGAVFVTYCAAGHVLELGL